MSNPVDQSSQPKAPEPAHQFLRLKSVVLLTGLGRSTIYRMVSSKSFPAPVRLSARAVAWRKSDVDAWSQSRPSTVH